MKNIKFLTISLMFIMTVCVTSCMDKDEEGNNYSSKLETREIEGEEVLNLRGVDSPVMIIPENGDVELSDEIGTSITIKQGEVGFVMASTNQLVFKAEKVKTLWLTLDE